MALAHKPKLSYEDYCLVPEDKRVELIDGNFLLSPAPNTPHQGASQEIARLLGNWVVQHRLGRVFAAPTDVILSAHDVVQPDILFISKERIHIIKNRGIEGAPDMVVEILSPKHEERDLILKRHLYGRFGVKEYWIVDPKAKTVSLYSLKESRLQLKRTHGLDDTFHSSVVNGFVLEIKEIFR